MLNVVATCVGDSCSTGVAVVVFGGVFMLSFSPRGILDEIWDLIESVSESFPT